ncbi:MAG: TetR/AcrR family transcriptional regulator [Acidimicrobiales bacterium]
MSIVKSTVDTRATILAAAISLLRTGGADALTVRNVADAAGCSTTGVYTWFGGKNGLVEAILIEGFDSFDDALGSAPTFYDTGLAYRRWALDNPTHYLVMFGHVVSSYEPEQAALDRAEESFFGLVELVGGDEAFAYHVWATVHGYVMLEITGIVAADNQFDVELLYRAGLNLLLQGLSPPQTGVKADGPNSHT